MGYVYGQTQSYAIGLWLLAATAALTLLLTLTAYVAPPHRRERHRMSAKGPTDLEKAPVQSLIGSFALHPGEGLTGHARLFFKEGGRSGDAFYRHRWSHERWCGRPTG